MNYQCLVPFEAKKDKIQLPVIECSFPNQVRNAIKNVTLRAVLKNECSLLQQQSCLYCCQGSVSAARPDPQHGLDRKCYDESNFHRDSAACLPAD